MADIAGALAAIEARFDTEWTATPKAFANQQGSPVVTDGDGILVPWVYFEASTFRANIRAIGKPGSHVVTDQGEIVAMVYVPVGSDRSVALGHAVTIGEIFRVKEFYQVEPGCCLRTWTPRVGRGESVTSENPDGNWWAVSVVIPFEFIRFA